MDKDAKETGTTKRERSVNFTPDETDLLVVLAEAKKFIIENKKSDSTTWREKDKAWKDIELGFNRSSGAVFRDHKHLKLKYEAIKRDTRKKSAQIERYHSSGGTGPVPTLTPAEQKVKELILSVDGNECAFDSDLDLSSTSKSDSDVTVLPADGQNAQTTEESDDSSNMIKIENQENSEPPRKKVCEASEEELLQCEPDISCPAENPWMDWNPMNLKTEEQPVLNKPKEKRLFDRLTEEKIEIAKIQKKIVEEELMQKIMQRRILEKEMVHMDFIQKLEKQQLLLKIEILKKELEKK